MSAQDILDRVQKYKKTGSGKWMATCPAHGDLSPSLSVTELEDGRVLINCYAGCGAIDVLASVGLDWQALYPDTDQHYKSLRGPSRASVEDFVVELAEHAKKTGQTLSREDKLRYAQALKRGGRQNQFVDTVVRGASGEVGKA
jgi:hypothetical protein